METVCPLVKFRSKNCTEFNLWHFYVGMEGGGNKNAENTADEGKARLLHAHSFLKVRKLITVNKHKTSKGAPH